MAVPLLVGAVQETDRLVALAAEAVGAAGRSGFSFGVPLPDADQVLSPAVLAARTCTL